MTALGFRVGGWRVRCLGFLWGSRRREAAARAPRTQLCQPTPPPSPSESGFFPAQSPAQPRSCVNRRRRHPRPNPGFVVHNCLHTRTRRVDARHDRPETETARRAAPGHRSASQRSENHNARALREAAANALGKPMAGRTAGEPRGGRGGEHAGSAPARTTPRASRAGELRGVRLRRVPREHLRLYPLRLGGLRGRGRIRPAAATRWRLPECEHSPMLYVDRKAQETTVSPAVHQA